MSRISNKTLFISCCIQEQFFNMSCYDIFYEAGQRISIELSLINLQNIGIRKILEKYLI